METKFMTIPEVAEALHTPADTIRYWRWAGKGPKSYKIGRRVLFKESDVLAFLAERGGQTEAPEASSVPTACPNCGHHLRIVAAE